MQRVLFTISALILIATACNNTYTPKPRGYSRIDFPAKQYQKFDSAGFPYSFEYPVYGKIVHDHDKNAEKYWLNVEFETFRCKFHISYKPINKNVEKFIEDAHTLAYKHAIKADAIDEVLIESESRKVYGLIYDIKGNAASSYQFYVTDSVKNFLRGSLYFDSAPNKDSLSPSIQFFQKDIVHLIETLHWK